MARQLLMGIDGGTRSIRVGFFDYEGHEISFAATEYEVIHQHPGWAEQRPLEWWEALKRSTKEAMKKGNITKDEVVAMSLDTTCCTVVFAKEDGTPVRDAIMWMDVRSAKEAKDISDTKHDVLLPQGAAPVENMPCKLLWVKRNEREIYDACDVLCEYQDWLMHRFLGKWVLSTSNAGGRWYYDPKNEKWPTDFYDMIGLSDAYSRFPKEVTWPGDYAGNLSRFAADELGLTTDTKVIQGAVDSPSGTVGMGVASPGRLTLVTGSSHLIIGFCEMSSPLNRFAAREGGVIRGLGSFGGGQTSSGSIVNWFKENMCFDILEKAKEMGVNPYDLLNEGASEIPPGSEGLIVLDYFQGNRDPYLDASVRGMIYGLSLNHTKYHIHRAIMEGVAFGTNNILKSIRERGHEVDEIIIGGGATNSDLFLQIHADVSNVSLLVPEQRETPTLGCAMFAAVGIGVYKDIEEAAQSMTRYVKKITPNYENHLKYQKIFEQYEKIYPLFKDWMHATNALSNM